MSEETIDIILTGSLDDVEQLMFDIRDAVNARADEEVIEMIVDNTTLVNGVMKICGRKRPSPE